MDNKGNPIEKKQNRQDDEHVGGKTAADDPECGDNIQGAVRDEIIGIISYMANGIGVGVMIQLREWKFSPVFCIAAVMAQPM